MHQINHVEIELLSDDVQRARALSERVARIHRDRIAPLLDRVFDEFGSGGAPIRLDRLGVDLGILSADTLEEDLIGKLEPALRRALVESLARQPSGGEPRAVAALELLEIFALTGGLPWWADPREGAVVARHFAQAAAEAGKELVALVRRLVGDPGALNRLARECDGAALAALAGRGGGPVERAGSTGSLDQDERRALLRELAHGGPQRATAAREPSRPSEHREGAEPGGQPRPSSPGASPPEPASAEGSLPQPPSVETSPPQPPSAETSLPQPRPQTPQPEPRSSPLPGAAAGSTASLDPFGPLPAAAIRAARRGMLARLDELYVHDAGLVILWPFLGHYFTRAGLLGTDGGFLDEAAQLQAVALTEALATLDPDPPEPRLPLAKLLCGRPLESDFQLVRPLSPEQLAESDLLLAAVLEHAPGLGEVSAEGLRTAFLQRPGALSTRDGAWLLQVERRTHDVVLDRVPWPWGWVRLPWMPDPLRVEW